MFARETLNNDDLRDVIDAFLVTAQNDATNTFSESQLLVLLADLFLAGSETTGKSLEWACLFMILYPEVIFNTGKTIVIRNCPKQYVSNSTGKDLVSNKESLSRHHCRCLLLD